MQGSWRSLPARHDRCRSTLAPVVGSVAPVDGHRPGADGVAGTVRTMANDPDPDPSGDRSAESATASRAGDRPDFGPSGYLPPRASARARKIVLRAPLGLQWVVGALVAGIAVVVAGVLFLTSSGPPEAPFVAAVALEQVDDAVRLDDLDVLVVTAGGPAVAYVDATEHDLTWCAESRRVEGLVDDTPATWHAGTGRGFGVDSLDRHPLLVHEGMAYVDPSRIQNGPRSAPEREVTGCR